MCKGSVLMAFKESIQRNQVEALEQLAVDVRNNEPAQNVTGGESKAEYQQRCADAYLNVVEVRFKRPASSNQQRHSLQGS